MELLGRFELPTSSLPICSVVCYAVFPCILSSNSVQKVVESLYFSYYSIPFRLILPQLIYGIVCRNVFK